MAITEETRNDLYEGLTEALGKQRATTLMEHLPPGGWGNVATKQDLQLLLSEVSIRFADLRTELHKTLRVHTLAMMAMTLTALGIVTGLARLGA